jgi:DNA adenine methylase
MIQDHIISYSESSGHIEPFLRWAGGKRSLVKHLQKFLPSNPLERIYFEPFLGAGSLFFALRPNIALLSDSNQCLIDCYTYVRDCPELIANYLCEHKIRNSERYYYEVRDKYNCSSRSAAQAARFIYLNKTCFNGIFRVNRKGKFNVPYGRKESPFLPDRKLLQSCSSALKNVLLKSTTFEEALATANKGDFIYLDPPYPPLNNTSNFTLYTKDRFNIDDQKRLAETVYELDARGCLIMMSNADIPLIREFYNKFIRHSLPVTRYITCKSIKHKVRELIITNYQIIN